MAEKVGEIYYDVTLELDQMIKDQRRAQQSLDKTASGLERLTPIAAAAKAALSGLAVMKVIDMADEWGQYASRIKMATKSTEEYTYVQERMLASANATFRGINETRESFIQLSPVLREMGLSLGQSVDVIDTFSGLLVVNAASAEKSKGAMDALAKSLQKGSIDADAWMTIYSTIDSVVDLIAESSGKSAAEIRRLGAEGKLGIDLLVNGVSDGSEKVAKQVKEMPTTVRDAIKSITNGLQEYIGWSNEAHGITATISKVVQTLGENFNFLADTALVAVTAGLARYAGGMAVASVATAAKAVAAMRGAAAEVALAQAQVAETAATLAQTRALQGAGISHAQVSAAALAHEAANKRLAAAQAFATASSTALGAALKGVLGFLGGPVGIAVIAALAAASIFKFGDSASKAVPKVDELTASVDKLTAAQLANQRNKAADAIGLLTSKARDANAAVKALERDQAALNKQLKEGRGGVDAKGMENVNRSLIEAQANADAATKELQEMINADYKLAEAQKQRANAPASKAKVTRSDPEVQKRLAGMRDELELAKLSGAAKARLQAIQKLGANATAEERAEAEKLATTIYDLNEAQKKLREGANGEKFDSKGYLLGLSADSATSEWAKIDAKEKEELSKHKRLLDERKLSQQMYEEGVLLIQQKYGLEREKLQDGLNQLIADKDAAAKEKAKQATDDMERQAQELGNALKESVMTPLERLNAELAKYDSLLASLDISQETYARAVKKANKEYQDSLNQMDQFTVRFAQNVQDQLGDTLYNSLTGNFKDIGTAWGQMLLKMGSQAVAANLARSLFGGAVEGGTGSGMFGSALSAIGSFFGLSGKRENGGDVGAGKMYEVNERGVPELLTVGNKQLLMMAGQSGNVTPLGGMDVAKVPSPEGRGGSWAAPVINMKFINAPSQPEVTQRQGTAGSFDVEVIFKQFEDRIGDGIARGSGTPYRALKGRFGLSD
ncbi:tape measure protein [Comamonas testosteroni]|uniref:tape measure protein n=1 Tax=Comamonas testosteroni TaxID=285 RepID=UPI00265D7DAE|nr:tape measure protein [Comamonas testosteroni]WKL15931.1 tape measure protein [Comamonas testosteroni]